MGSVTPATAATSDNISAIEAVEKAMEAPAALIERGVLRELAKHWNATGTVCGPLFSGKFGDKVPLYALSVPAMSSILAEARKAHEELAVARSVHRWNVDRYGENLAVCRNEHDKGDPCEWETFVPLARAEAAEARAGTFKVDRDNLQKVVNAVLTWAEQRCPCENDQPNPCPLCGASVENLEACKSAENTIPRHLLADLRRARTLLNGGSDAQG